MILFRRTIVLALAVLLMTLTACQQAGPDPTATPDDASLKTASALFAQPTRSVRATPSPEPAAAVELALNRTLARMEQAVLDGGRDEYLAHVWTEDATFTAEQERWAQDWVDHPVSVFDLSISGLSAAQDADWASARLTITWSQRDQDSSGGATFSAVFFRDGERWFYGGEDWRTIELDNARLRYFSGPLLDTHAEAEAMAADLPDVVSRLAALLDITPDQPVEIKLYDSAATLQTVTRLSMAVIPVWNQPGEAIKLTLGPSSTAPRPPDVAREITRWLLYLRSGGEVDRFPWWLEEGIAEYGAAQFRTLSQQNRVIERIAALSSAPAEEEQRLFTWDELADRAALADAQPSLGSAQAFELARDQSYTLVHYAGEAFGPAERNAWIAAIAQGQSLEDATAAHLGQTFEALSDGWRGWLREQL